MMATKKKPKAKKLVIKRSAKKKERKPEKQEFTDILARRRKEPPEKIDLKPSRTNSFKSVRSALFMFNPNDTFIIPPLTVNGEVLHPGMYGRMLYRNWGTAKVEFWKPTEDIIQTGFWAPGTEVIRDRLRGPIQMPESGLRTPKMVEEVVTNLWTEYGPNFWERLDAADLLKRARLTREDLTEGILRIAKMRAYFRIPVRQTPLDKSNSDWYKSEDPNAAEKIPLKSKKPVAKEPKAPKEQTGPRRPGVITTIIECLQEASKKKPTTKEAILAVLVEKFDRPSSAMKNTIASQIPAGLRTEKGMICKTDGKGGWWLDGK